MKYKNYTITPQDEGFDLTVERNVDKSNNKAKNDTIEEILGYNMSFEYTLLKIINREAELKHKEDWSLKDYITEYSKCKNEILNVLK